MLHRRWIVPSLGAWFGLMGLAEAQTTAPPASVVVLRPDRVFDGTTAEAHAGWVVAVRGDRIEAAGPPDAVSVPEGARVVDLKGMTLLPGLIDAHSHILLYEYTETKWENQVLKDSLALRICRATNHLKLDLDAGFTTLRDLGTEGAGYADVGIRQAVDQGIVPGPRLLVATRAIVATGSYAPSSFAPEWHIPQGAEEADGDALRRVVRDQIGRGADVIKIYADNGKGATFTEDEIRLIVATAQSQGRPVAAHAMTAEGMRRAALGGVTTIEHGDGGTPEVFKLMKDRNVAWCPTLSVYEVLAGRPIAATPTAAEPARLRQARAAFRAGLEAGVTIINGSDVGAFAHGTAGRELELMVAFGMTPPQALQAATSVAARVIGLGDRVGRVKPEFAADLIAVAGDPAAKIQAIRQVRMVMKGGRFVREP